MDKQKMVTTSKQTTSFPVVDALLITPTEGKMGKIGVCSNTTAPGQVINEIEQSHRKDVSVLGALIVSRDGTERMILNTLAHPTLKYLILFSEESKTFAPSTNLLLALMNGLDPNQGGNYIKDGIAASAHYPNLTKKILDDFKKNIIVIPAYLTSDEKSKTIIKEYIEWLKPHIDRNLYEVLKDVRSQKTIYYDSLNRIIDVIRKLPNEKKSEVFLDPKDFQHLQPPKIELKPIKKVFTPQFRVSSEQSKVRLDIKIGEKSYVLKGEDTFLMSYSLMKHLGKEKEKIPFEDQLLIGAELSRVSTCIINKITYPSFIKESKIIGKIEIPLESKTSLVTDKKFYYKVNVKENFISVMCLAFDVCESVFELRSKNIPEMIEKLAIENRFEEYEMDILHRIDIGIQIGRAAIAAKLGYSFIQDFSLIFKINKEKLPFLIADSDSFLDVHKTVLRRIYTEGITEEHGDKQKGLARTASVLAIYRNMSQSLKELPLLYKQGEQDTKTMREKYKAQLLRFDHDGSYSYGERTRTFFKFDQLLRAPKVLKKDLSRALIIQRFDPSEDMGTYTDETTGKIKYTHDPCLTHDIFFVQGGKLHSFHIARAHNTVNAYPENIFGLFDAYTKTIQKGIKLPLGDMFMLSNRANILLLTEEQRTKNLLGEPSKPKGDYDEQVGPHYIGEKTKLPKDTGGVAYTTLKAKKVSKRPQSKLLDVLENYNGVNTVTKAIDYLKDKGVMHNNPVLSEFYAGTSDPQADQLAFFQANVFGKKIYGTAVYMNRSLKNKEKDIEDLNYLLTLYSKKLGVPLGDLEIFYVAYRK